MFHRRDESSLVSENTLKGISDLLSEVRLVLETALARAEDRIQERLVEMHEEKSRVRANVL
jgi:hypothetical protein